MIRDGLLIVALLCLTWGCYLAWPPLGWIVPSVLVIAGLVMTERGKPNAP